MYFYVDESGHTGPNLFDDQQPVLYYGVLSSAVNLDLLALPAILSARAVLGVDRLHANVIGYGGLARIAPLITRIQKRLPHVIDLYQVDKADHAVISFFDQVFDSGMNDAVPWRAYWTPLRYRLLLEVAKLFDRPLSQAAWRARINLNESESIAELVGVCNSLLDNLNRQAPIGMEQVIKRALRWTIENPRKIGYNVSRKKDLLDITPNLIGFQSVLHGIGQRTPSKKTRATVVVDQQSQFNRPQRSLAEFYATARHVPWESGPGMPKMDTSKAPTAPLAFLSSTTSPGLELVDCYLWILKRLLEKKQMPADVMQILKPILPRCRTDEVSLAGIARRWRA